jgi:hypothetical protein
LLVLKQITFPITDIAISASTDSPTETLWRFVALRRFVVLMVDLLATQ